MTELPIIQKTYDLIAWYVPILNKLSRDHKFALGDRIISGLYDLLEGLLRARFAKEKRDRLSDLNTSLDILRYQTRLLHDFKQINTQRYEHVSQRFSQIGSDLGGWIKQQGHPTSATSRQPVAPDHQL
jgi:23S rRNA-intervening sequence protein